MPAFAQCTAFDTSHAPPHAYGSCSSVALESATLTTNSSGAGSGFFRLDVMCTNGQTPPCTPTDGTDSEDNRVVSNNSDVRCAVGGIPGCTSAGADYTGKLLLQLGLRVTDHASNVTACDNGLGNPPCIPATVRDFTFSVPVQCNNNGGVNGATCNVNTTLDALEPGTVKEFQRAVTGITSLKVVDSGPDGLINPSPVDDPLGLGCPSVCGTGDETPYQRMGYFNP